jgi:hypothetical protein
VDEDAIAHVGLQCQDYDDDDDNNNNNNNNKGR